MNTLHVRRGVLLNFDTLTSRGFASPYAPAAQQLSQAVVGQASWPTFTSEPGASACHTPHLLSLPPLAVAMDHA